MALGLILSLFLKLPEFRYPVSLERDTSSVIIITGAEKTIMRKWKLTNEGQDSGRDDTDTLRQRHRGRPALTSLCALLPTSKERPAAQLPPKRQLLPLYLTGGQRAWSPQWRWNVILLTTTRHWFVQWGSSVSYGANKWSSLAPSGVERGR